MVDAKRIVESWLDALEARDADRLLGPLADDVEFHVEAMERPLTGKETVRGLLGNLATGYASIRVERQKIIASGHDVAVLARLSVTMASDLELAGETLPTAGKQLVVLGALFVTVNDEGKITRLARVRDNMDVIRQLGISADRMRGVVEKLQQRLAA